jgi:predicted 2-oxoglutarate/Fe(II)-dependent dioxygenase YbiX
MIGTFEKLILSEDDCKKIIAFYDSKVVFREKHLISIDRIQRKQKNYHETDENSWIHKLVNKFIKLNLGDKFSLLERVTILKYEPGDFFSEHTDGPYNTSLSKNLPYHFYGGVELCERNEFKGGEFFIKGKNVDYKKGRLFTHGFNDTHGVKEVVEGIRWSIHFLIKEEKEKQLI